MANSLLPSCLLIVVTWTALPVGYVTCDCANNSTTVLTYNTGLTTTVFNYELRRGPVAEALKSMENEADFVCLQELWYEADVKNVLDQLEPLFPYHYSAIHAGVSQLRDSIPNFWTPPGFDTIPCKLGRLKRLLRCIIKKCFTSQTQEACVLEKCSKQLFRLSQNCRSCFSVSVGSNDPQEIWQKCGNYFPMFNRMNNPGLLVLSKQPLTSVKYVNYHPGFAVLLERGYIEAQVQGGHTYVCTHLASIFPFYIEVGLPIFSSFEEMNRAEILQLNATYHGLPIVALGDFNTGSGRNEPDLSVIDETFSGNYDLLINAMSLQNPYLQNNGHCTFCSSDNPVLLATVDQSGDEAIDFVLTSPGISADVTSAKRVLDPADVMLSDHYGVTVDVCAPP